MMNQPNPQELTYNWDVKIADSLRKPVTIIALDSNKDIREVVSEAVTEYVQKQSPKVGE